MDKNYIQERKKNLIAQRDRGFEMQQQAIQLQNQGAELIATANGALSEYALMEKALAEGKVEKESGTDTNH